MSSLQDARDHLAKAREFLQAAAFSRDLELYSAATSNAVISGINSKDAICLRLTGATRKTENHLEAVAELKAAVPADKTLATTLGRLLKLKTKSQYQPAAIATTDAGRACEWAQRLLDAAEAVVTAR